MPSLQEHVIVLPVLNWRSVAEAAPIVPLHGLPQDVGTRVPEHLLAWEREGREGVCIGGRGRGGGVKDRGGRGGGRGSVHRGRCKGQRGGECA